MHRSFDYLIKPILEEFDFKHIVEVGAKEGFNTKKLIEICNKKNTKLSVIDPFPNFNVFKFQKELGNFDLYEGLSLDELPNIQNYDVVLLDGDHNYYTLKSELELIAKTCEEFPLVFFHDVAWPYARRDMYYNPENIPDEHINDYERMGIQPNKDTLIEGGLNGHLLNAKIEYTEKNGVLTAIEDFIKECELKLSFNKIEFKNGIGILARKNSEYIISKFEELANSKELVGILERDNNKIQADYVLLKYKNEKKINSLINEKKYIEEKNRNLNEKNLDLKIKFEELQREIKIIVIEKENLEVEKEDLINRNKKLNSRSNSLKEKLNDLESKYKNENKRIKNTVKNKDSLINELNKDIINNKSNIALARIYEHTRLTKGISDSNNIMEFGNMSSRISFYLRIMIFGDKKTIIKIRENIKLLKESKYFDVNEYLLRNPDIYYSRINPYIHFLFYGGFEGRFISKKFNTKYYLENNSDVRIIKMNPLIHFIKFGEAEARLPIEEESTLNRNSIIEKKIFADDKKRISNNRINYEEISRIVSNELVTIVIPIYNAYDDLQLCIDSIVKNTKINFKVLLIDDCSPDENIRPYIIEISKKYDFIEYKFNDENQGFVKNVNLGFKASKDDVVLLNSDTIVTERWLTKLILSAYSDKNIGTVTPLSNAAGAFSVPYIGEENIIPSDVDIDYMGELVFHTNKGVEYIEAPTGNGFCLYIKREVIKEIGEFDADNFEKGYCEENDFCMRALKAGYKNIINHNVYIYHKRSASFGDNKNELINKHRKILDTLHPEYTNLVKNFVQDKKYLQIRENIKYNLDNRIKIRPSILYVIHEGGGGTPQTNIDLIKNVIREFDCYILTSNMSVIKLTRYTENGEIELFKTILKNVWTFDLFRSNEFREIYYRILTSLNFNLVHVRHLFKHTVDIVDILIELNIKYILSFHDFYYYSPTINLITTDGKYYENNYNVNSQNYSLPEGQLKDTSNKIVTEKFSELWKDYGRYVIKNAEALITTAEYVKSIYIKVFELDDKIPFEVIEHGRDFIKNEVKYIPKRTNKIKLLVPGNISIAKGLLFLNELSNYEDIEIHIIGNIQNFELENRDKFIIHGRYNRENFNNYVDEIKPDFIGIFSVFPETFCHTLTEGWAAGVPVIVNDVGVIKNRMDCLNYPYTINVENVEESYEKIKLYYNDMEYYDQSINELSNMHFKSTYEMAISYIQMYKEIIFNDNKE